MVCCKLKDMPVAQGPFVDFIFANKCWPCVTAIGLLLHQTILDPVQFVVIQIIVVQLFDPCGPDQGFERSVPIYIMYCLHGCIVQTRTVCGLTHSVVTVMLLGPSSRSVVLRSRLILLTQTIWAVLSSTITSKRRTLQNSDTRCLALSLPS